MAHSDNELADQYRAAYPEGRSGTDAWAQLTTGIGLPQYLGHRTVSDPTMSPQSSRPLGHRSAEFISSLTELLWAAPPWCFS